ncbi:hypothetical protein ACERK3_09280 [Phycisphaerales bacterium AB-hyl4]|uniref:Uncharacterized protein n=1 Tax=Natronomicrosphaera hydrolytica TaxID=3242702 RepID=A0ABV4U4F8_9BACT
MMATPHHKNPYHPMILANGSDAVLLNYTGSMASGLTGHAHLEQHQGTLCGWYKPAHAGCVTPRYVPLLVESGYQIMLNGEVCDISDYEQQFFPQQALLKTRATARGAVVEIVAFLTHEHTLVERYKIISLPSGTRAQLAFYVRSTAGHMGGLVGVHHTQLEYHSSTPDQLAFDYHVDTVRGAGVMQVDRPADENYDAFPGLQYNQVKVGFTATKYLTLFDTSDTRSYRKQLNAQRECCRTLPYARIKRAHQTNWRTYAAKNSLTVPDATAQYLYDYSMYYLRANQYAATGAISCGPLPHLWAGGVHCPYDAAFAQQALLRNNRLEEGRAHVAFHRQGHAAARKLARSAGISGAIYSGWSDCRGQHLGVGHGRNWQDYLLKYKPLMPAYLVLDAYWQWVFDPQDADHRRNLPYMRDILALAIERFIIEHDDHATMRPCAPGNESEIVVENDTLNGLAYARALEGYAQMCQALGDTSAEQHGRLAGKLFKGIAKNTEQGVLLPYPDAPYLTGLQLDFYLLGLPAKGSRKSVQAGLRAMRTSWGLDSDQPSEAYRDWPWLNCRAGIALAHLKQPRQAFEWLLHAGSKASSLGALPEKIRMDGYAIGYGYVSPHALYAWMMSHAFAHDGPDDELAILWGFDGRWRDMSVENVRLAAGLLISLSVVAGKVTRVEIVNRSAQPLQRTLNLNPAYTGIKNRAVTIPSRDSIIVES